MSSVIRKYLKQTILVCLLLPVIYCSGQIELSSGFDINYPVLINSNNAKINYGQITFGVRVGIAYKPPETQFFPILNISFGRTRLPLKQFDENVAALNFDYLNVMLNENYVMRFPNSEVFLYGGVGFSYLMRKGITIAGAGGEAMQAAIDSTGNITSVSPAMNIGIEYNYGESAGKPLYLTMGLNFQYILLLPDRNFYSITVDERNGIINNYSANLTGNIISPGFYIAIHYLLNVHKKSGMYL